MSTPKLINKFTVDAFVSEYLEYQSAWQAALGGKLMCVWEVRNRSDVFASAVVGAGETVGHFPKKISSISLAARPLWPARLIMLYVLAKVRRKSMQGKWLETSFWGKVMDSSRYSMLCCSFPEKNTAHAHHGTLWFLNFWPHSLSQSSHELCSSPPLYSKVLLYGTGRSLLLLKYFKMDIFTVPRANSHIAYTHTHA